jgi:DNA-binding NtrC family response regulator
VSGDDLPPIIGGSGAIKKAMALVERFAPTGLPILLVGPTGTGKDLFARHIHARSRRRGELVDVNCGALPHDMIESLLFGHRRGAFTGAVESVIGHLERASGGTLFLDEVLHLSAAGQVKLLRAIETGDVQPLGESRKRAVDLRVVAAAQDDAAERLTSGAFRRDLFQRLAGVVIALPPLAERPEDLVLLATHFAGRQGQVLEPGARGVLTKYVWPGNVRELRLAIERAGCLVENGTLPPAAILEAIEMGGPAGRPTGSRGALLDEEVREVLVVLKAHGWDTQRAAAILGIGRSTLYDRLRVAGISLRVLRKQRGREFIGIPWNPEARAES